MNTKFFNGGGNIFIVAHESISIKAIMPFAEILDIIHPKIWIRRCKYYTDIEKGKKSTIYYLKLLSKSVIGKCIRFKRWQ
jgi:hypothetical protein